MSVLIRFVELSVDDRLLVILTASLLAFLTIALRLVSLQILLMALRKAAVASPRREPGKPWASGRIVWAVAAVARRVPALGNCLCVALAAKLLLSISGCPSSLRIGVAKRDSGQLEAHAWLEDNGIILIGSVEHDRYAPLPVFDRALE